jgi:uncharacterized membrane protein YukC
MNFLYHHYIKFKIKNKTKKKNMNILKLFKYIIFTFVSLGIIIVTLISIIFYSYLCINSIKYQHNFQDLFNDLEFLLFNNRMFQIKDLRPMDQLKPF